MRRKPINYLIGSVCLTVLVLFACPVLAQTVSFDPAVDFMAGQQPWFVDVNDVNQDGNLDFAVANFGSDNVSILLGNGAGGFGPATNFATGDGPRHIASGDFNGDGKPDLATANFNGAFNGQFIEGVSTLLGTGGGSFGSPTAVDTFASPDFIAIGDINSDALPDLAVTGPGSGSTLSTNLGDGIGGFSARSNIFLDPVNNLDHCCPHWVVLADLNQDSNLDMVATLLLDNEIAVLLGDGLGEFGTPTFFSLGAGSGPMGAALTDLDGDGNLDLAVASSSRNTVSVLLGDGTGSFGSVNDFAVGITPMAVAAGDFNGNGDLDLSTVNADFMADAGTVSVILGNGDGTFGGPNDFLVGNDPLSIAAGDFNGDQKLDLAVANNGGNDVSVLINNLVTKLILTIDIKPGSFPNSINLGSQGTVPVAIFSTPTFDATTVDPLTVTLASAPVQLKGKGTPMASSQDKNGDGLLDLVVHVSTEALQLSQSDTEATLDGQTTSGQQIQGTDTVRIVQE